MEKRGKFGIPLTWHGGAWASLLVQGESAACRRARTPVAPSPDVFPCGKNPDNIVVKTLVAVGIP